MQTPEDRIRRQYKSLKGVYYHNNFTMSDVFMRLARQWKRPIREIRVIVGKPRRQS